MKITVVDGIRKICEPANKQELLVKCEWCGATYTTRHNKYTARCIECGKRAAKYSSCKCLLGKGCTSNAVVQRRLDKLLNEYSELAAQGYKVPDEIKGYIERRID